MKTRFLLFLFIFSSVTFSEVIAEEYQENTSPHFSKIQETFSKLDFSGNYTDHLDYADMNVLPIGIRQKVGNNEFTLAVSNVTFHPTHAEMAIFARLTIPQGNKTLFFSAQNIKLTYGGNIIGDASLVLLDDIDIPLGGSMKLTLKGGMDAATGKGLDLTYVTIDCEGFKELSVVGEFEVSKSLVTRVGANLEPTGEAVKTTIQTVVTDWNDILLGISLPPFQMTGLDGFVFNIEDAFFDFSDSRNPSGSPMELESPLWRGVFAKNLSITMPKQFSNEGKRTSFAAQHLSIGSNGVSGDFLAENILSIKEGNASGWAFSLDYLRLKIDENRPTQANFRGMLELPVSETTRLQYTGMIDAENRYTVRVTTLDSIRFEPFFAKGVIAPNSFAQLLVDNGKFKPEAMLHGYMDIKTSISLSKDPDKTADFKRIEFRDFHIMTFSPYLEIGYLGYEGEIKLLGLPVSVSKIRLESKQREVCFGFNLNLNLDEQFVHGTTRLELVSKYVEVNEKGKWKFHKVNLTDLAIKDCDIAGVMTLNGSLLLMDGHPVYGDGFSGSLNLSFKKILKQCSIDVNAAFGKKDNFNYWFVDGLVGFPGIGIPVIPPVNISGFGGGLSYKMRRTLGGGLGSSKTGCGYVPDENMRLGLKAAVKLNMVKENMMNGEASFEIIFNESGGVNFIGFYGFAKFLETPSFLQEIEKDMQKLFGVLVDTEENSGKSADELDRIKKFEPDKAAKTLTPALQHISGAAFAAAIGIQYDFESDALDANFETFVHVAGGLVRGSAPGNSAGRAVMHISPRNWYVLIGTPDAPVGLEVGIPNYLTIGTESYFMMGDDIPGSPPPDKMVTTILGEDFRELDYMRSFNELSSGRGLAFGSEFSINAGNKRFLCLYAHFDAKIGFDAMMRDYGHFQCAGSNHSPGINGWYANGQVYAYLYGELGVEVNLKIIKGKFCLISGGMAALMQAQLPNPVWLSGKVGVNFSILGGLVKGNMGFKFTLGEKCDLQVPGGSPLDFTIISDLTPADQSQDVDVFTSPQLALSLPLNKSFIVDGEGEKKEYRTNLDEFMIWQGSSPLSGQVELNRDGDVATFIPHEILPPKEKLKLVAKIGFQERRGNEWVTTRVSGQASQEARTIEFTTGDAPKSIEKERNILYSYPVIDQQYFYPDESGHAYVQLRQGQSSLFVDGWDYQCQVIKEGNLLNSIAFGYDVSGRRLYFDLPRLSKGSTYELKFIAIPQSKGSVDHTEKVEVSLLNDGENSATQTVATATDVVLAGGNRLLLEYAFSTSKHATFRDKVSRIKAGKVLSKETASSIYSLGREVSGFEGFDISELSGSKYSGKPLIDVRATLEEDYFRKTIIPLIYAEYPVNGFLRVSDEVYGIPPHKAIEIYSQTGLFPYTYDLEPVAYGDYRDLKYKVTNNNVKNHPLYGSFYFPLMEKGHYTIILQYVFPNGELGTSDEFKFKK